MNRAYSKTIIWGLFALKELLVALSVHTRTVGVSHAKLKEEKLLLNIA
ncbi:hypothetical protein [Sphingobacterium tabacisoli]|uniref:Uncharacterized protein n=1 Tax=Sphingobacterium tabacisoli TaxID=2044855 RepID=A0ABW5L446_9SPHI|nr:hypothetical protein [Sphingobacterium tabacisoli]